VFAGEYAAQTTGAARPDNRNNWQAALAEAGFMTGLERNGDVVRMASYAPLLAHVDAWQWTPDLIWFDNLRSYGTPNYYVQQIFSRNVGTRVLPASVQAGEGLYSVASLDERTHEMVVTVVNTTAKQRAADIKFDGMAPAATVQVTTLESADLKAENSFDQPTAVAPVTTTIDVKAADISVQLPAQSVTVYRIPLK
jgi:alpha-N-arabinofuranosidase